MSSRTDVPVPLPKTFGAGGIYSIHLSNSACGYEKAHQHIMGQLARFANDHIFPFKRD